MEHDCDEWVVENISVWLCGWYLENCEAVRIKKIGRCNIAKENLHWLVFGTRLDNVRETSWASWTYMKRVFH